MDGIGEPHPEAEPARPVRRLDLEAVGKAFERIGIGEAAAVGLRNDDDAPLLHPHVLDHEDRRDVPGDFLRMGSAEQHQGAARALAVEHEHGGIARTAGDGGDVVAELALSC